MSHFCPNGCEASKVGGCCPACVGACEERSAATRAAWIERVRREQHERLVQILGDRAALDAQNAIDQVGIEKPEDRCEVVDALIDSIEAGQAFAIGETAVEVRPCPACDGTTHSRSARGKCRACCGWGRRQVKCRACAELDPGTRMRTTCPFCRSTGQLDPVANRETILRQHREWWERTTKMKPSETREARIRRMMNGPVAMNRDQAEAYIDEADESPKSRLPVELLLTDEERAAAKEKGGGDFVIDVMREGDAIEVFCFETLRRSAMWLPASFVRPAPPNGVVVARLDLPLSIYDVDAVRLIPRVDIHAGPPERPTPRRGVVSREHGAISMYWDHDLGDDATGIGTLEKPYATLASADAAAEYIAKVWREASGEPVLPHSDAGIEPSFPAPTSPMPRVIAAALFRAQKAIQNVPKNLDNEGDGYSYTSAELIIAEARRALHDAGLCITAHRWWKSAPDELTVEWLYIHESGEQYVCPGVPMPIVTDGREKRAADKGLATALTYCESQFERVALQIPRIGRAEDADARADVGDGGRRRRQQQTQNETPLPQELNDAVVAITGAIEKAKDAKAISGIYKRMEGLVGLPEPLRARLTTSLEKKADELGLHSGAKP